MATRTAVASRDRRAQHETLRREVNENISSTTSSLGSADTTELWEFICECSAESCSARVEMNRLEYERLRGNARWFVVAPRHVDDAIEHVVTQHRRFWIVEKLGEAADIAVDSAPR